jgi:hypothetical protein
MAVACVAVGRAVHCLAVAMTVDRGAKRTGVTDAHRKGACKCENDDEASGSRDRHVGRIDSSPDILEK